MKDAGETAASSFLPHPQSPKPPPSSCPASTPISCSGSPHRQPRCLLRLVKFLEPLLSAITGLSAGSLLCDVSVPWMRAVAVPGGDVGQVSWLLPGNHLIKETQSNHRPHVLMGTQLTSALPSTQAASYLWPSPGSPLRPLPSRWHSPLLAGLLSDVAPAPGNKQVLSKWPFPCNFLLGKTPNMQGSSKKYTVH